MELFFVSLICSYQSYQGPACNTITGAYWEKVHGQKIVDKATKLYVDPYVKQLPSEIKSLGVVAYMWNTKHARIGLYRGLSWDIKVDKFNNNAQTIESTVNYLTFSRSFP